MFKEFLILWKYMYLNEDHPFWLDQHFMITDNPKPLKVIHYETPYVVSEFKKSVWNLVLSFIDSLVQIQPGVIAAAAYIYLIICTDISKTLIFTIIQLVYLWKQSMQLYLENTSKSKKDYGSIPITFFFPYKILKK